MFKKNRFISNKINFYGLKREKVENAGTKISSRFHNDV
jgi:hypothetical protein